MAALKPLDRDKGQARTSQAQSQLKKGRQRRFFRWAHRKNYSSIGSGSQFNGVPITRESQEYAYEPIVI